MVDRFAIEAEAPAVPEDVRVGGAALADGVLAMDGAANAVVRWSSDGPLRARGSAEDLIYTDLTAASGAAVRCAFSDEGRGEIPASVVQRVAFGALPATATLSVHRVRLGTFIGPGIDLGEVRFDLAVVGRAIIAAE
jgi:hypothetical protein